MRRELPTRWSDDDTYGHVNNVVYYSYFDTVINSFLIEAGGLSGERLSGLRFYAPIPASLNLRQVDLASALESFCRGLGSSWFTERFHRNALVTHFQHGQVFCTARQLKDYAVTRCRLHQRAPQR